MRAIINIAASMLKESIRSKLFWSLTVFLIFFLGFSVYISFLSLDTPARFILNAGMAGLSLVSLTVTILFGLYSLYEEKNRCELYVILNRISRPVYLIGRFSGTVLIQAIFAFVMASGIFFVVLYIDGTNHFEIFAAAFWSILEFGLLMAVGIFFYTLDIGFTLNAMLVLATYVIGHSTREAVLSFIALGQFGSKIHLFIVKVICVILPDFDFFNFRLALLHHEPIPALKIFVSAGYGFFYLTAIMILASIIMKKKDM